MYLFISVFLIFISLILLYLTVRNIFSFSFFTGIILVLTFIGIVRVSESPYFPLLFYFSLGIFFYTVGIFFINFLKRFSPKIELDKFRKLPFNFPFKFKTPFWITFAILIILNIVAIIFLFYTKGIPFFQENTEVGKVEITSGSNWLLLRTLRIFLPVLIFILFLYILKTGKFAAKLLFIALIFIMATIYLFYGFKGYIFGYLAVPLLMLWSMVGKISPAKVILLMILVLVVTLPLVGGMIGNRGLIPIFSTIFDRFTIVKADGINYIFNIIVPKEGLFMGTTLKMDIEGVLYKVGILKKEAYPFNAYLVEKMQGFNPGGKIQTDSTLFGDFYVNFGLLGGIIGMFLFGIIMQFFYIKAIRSSKNIFYLPFYIIFQSALYGAITAGKTLITLMDMGVMVIFILFLIFLGYLFFSLPTGRIIFLRKN